MKISYLTAFGAGVLYFLSPCFLPLIPSYLSYIAGISFKELRHACSKFVYLNIIAFVIGFSLIFILIGISASAIGIVLLKYKHIWAKIGGIIIILLGFYLLFQNKLILFSRSKNFLPRIKPVGIVGSFLVGIAFAFSFTPCATPVLSAILIYTSTKATITKGILLLSFFSLGLGLPFILAGIFISSFIRIFQKLKRYLRVIEIFTAILLILFGIIIFLGGELQSFWKFK